MLFVYLVFCQLLPTFIFMGLMRRKLTLMLNIASTCLMLQKFTAKQPSARSSRTVRDKKLLVRLHWLRKPVVRLKNRRNIWSAIIKAFYVVYIDGFFLSSQSLDSHSLVKQLEKRKLEDEQKRLRQQEEHFQRVKARILYIYSIEIFKFDCNQ